MSVSDEPARLSLRRSFRALKTRNYRLFFIGQLISQSGTWMQRTAQSWLVLELSGSPLALGTVTALQFVPVLIFSLAGGLMADRIEKRKLIFLSQALQMVLAFVLGSLTATGAIQLWHVYVLAFLHGTLVSLDQPARRAFPSDLVPRDQVPSAVALNATLFNAARVAGPALGGLCIVLIGLAGCFILNGFSYVAVLAGLAMMRPSEFFGARPVSTGGLLSQVAEGIGYVRRTPDVAFIIILLAMLGAFGFNFNVVLALLARYALESTALGFGGLNSALGIGSVVGSVLVASRSSVTLRVVALAAAGFAFFLFLLALVPSYPVALGVLFITGWLGITFSTSANTTVQLICPDELRGRVMSIYGLVWVGVTPIGAAFTGLLAERWNVRVALAVDALLCGLGILLGLLYLRAAMRRREAGMERLGV